MTQFHGSFVRWPRIKSGMPILEVVECLSNQQTKLRGGKLSDVDEGRDVWSMSTIEIAEDREPDVR